MKVELTLPLRQQILAGVRAGGYPQVAAEAWGVAREVLEEWLARGKAGCEPYASFALALMEAHAQARLHAEMAVFREASRNWLEHGPGRESDEQPGWSTAVKPAERAPETRNPWLDPEWTRLLRLVLDALAPYPEARLRVAELVQRKAA